MTKKDIMNRIESALETLSLENSKSMYSLGELEKIAQTADVDMIYVMKYLRYGRV